jgi:hypothetical protein
MAPHQAYDAATGQFITTPSAEMPGGGLYHDVDLNGGGKKDVEGGPYHGDSFTRDDHRRIDKQGTLLPERELEAQRHGTWVEGVFHIITAVIGEPSPLVCPRVPHVTPSHELLGTARAAAPAPWMCMRAMSCAWAHSTAALLRNSDGQAQLTPAFRTCRDPLPCAVCPVPNTPPPPSRLFRRLGCAVPALLLFHPGLGGRHHNGATLWRHHLVSPLCSAYCRPALLAVPQAELVLGGRNRGSAGALPFQPSRALRWLGCTAG